MAGLTLVAGACSWRPQTRHTNILTINYCVLLVETQIDPLRIAVLNSVYKEAQLSQRKIRQVTQSCEITPLSRACVSSY